MGASLGALGWHAFKLAFGLFSLVSVWAKTALSSGTLWARDSDEEKRELAAGKSTCSVCGGGRGDYGADILQRRRSTGAWIRRRSRGFDMRFS